MHRIIISIALAVFLGGAFNTSSASDVAVENLTLKKDHAETWAIAGSIRNLESKQIQGYVKIKFLSSEGDILKTVKAYVNGMDPLGPGQAGPFEYWTSSRDFKNVSNYQVIFVDSKWH